MGSCLVVALGAWLKEVGAPVDGLVSMRMVGSAFLQKHSLSFLAKLYLLKVILPSLVF